MAKGGRGIVYVPINRVGASHFLTKTSLFAGFSPADFGNLLKGVRALPVSLQPCFYPKDIMPRRVRTRFAPSPTGPLHIGGVRTALYNFLFAKKHRGDFLLRIEDTDRNRFVPGTEDYIIEALRWCGITIDEGVPVGGPHHPYRQSERKELGIYSRYAQQLVDNGNAYLAFDTPESLEAMRNRHIAAGNVAPQYDHRTRGEMENSLTLSTEEVKKRLASGTPYVIRLKVPPSENIAFTT